MDVYKLAILLHLRPIVTKNFSWVETIVKGGQLDQVDEHPAALEVWPASDSHGRDWLRKNGLGRMVVKGVGISGAKQDYFLQFLHCFWDLEHFEWLNS